MDELDYLIDILNSKQNKQIHDMKLFTERLNNIPIFPEVKLGKKSNQNATKMNSTENSINNLNETEKKKKLENNFSLPNISKGANIKILGKHILKNTNQNSNSNIRQDNLIKESENFDKTRKDSFIKLDSYKTREMNDLTAIRYLDFRPYIDNFKIMKERSEMSHPSKRDTGYYFKIVGSESLLVKYLLEDNGFFEVTKLDQEWSIMWASSSIKKKVFSKLKPYQKVNHFPRNAEITRKDLLYKNISKFKTIFPTKISFGFIPDSYLLPNEKNFLEDAMEADPNQLWIVKPVAWSQGRGIFVTNNITDIVSENPQIACKYITNPFLIDGYKFDMRIYVLVTSVSPLRIYVYEDGFARFATEKYYIGQPYKASKFMHLTNYAVNKQSKNFVHNTDPFLDGVGSKWSLTALKKYFKNNNINWEEISHKINDIIIKTFISAEEKLVNAFVNSVNIKNSCFELFGFDILLDSNLNPWLIEVNLSPSIHCDSPLDLKIKGELIAEVFDIVRIIPLNLREKGNESNSSIDYSKFFNQNIPSAEDLKIIKEISHLDSMKDFKFTKEIKEIIWNTDEEFKRLKNFKRIFPDELSLNYRKLFSKENPINLLLSIRELEKNVFKKEFTKKIKKQNLINFSKKNK